MDVDIEALEAKKHKDLDEAIAITDVDPQYFSELDDRLVREKFSVRNYIEDTREILKARLLAGQEMDDTIRIDQQFVEEQKRLDQIRVCSVKPKIFNLLLNKKIISVKYPNNFIHFKHLCCFWKYKKLCLFDIKIALI